MAIKILAQQPLPDNTFMLQLGGLSSDTKPTDAFVATGSQFFEDDTDAVFSFNGSTWDLDKNGQMKDLPVVTSTDNGKILKVDNGVWSIGIDSGSSLPSMTGKNGKVLGVTLDAQDHEQIEWVTPSGGGAEKFVVTLTEDDGTWTADKTIAEIVAADEAGKNVVASFQYMGQIPTELPKVSWIHDPEGTSSVFMFSGIIYGESEEVAFIVGQPGDSSNMWQVTFTPIPTSSNAPLIVTLTEEQSTGNIVGDKTFGEVYAAVSAGKTVYIYIMGGYAILNSCSLESGVYTIVGAAQGMTFEGTENDYITITMGN